MMFIEFYIADQSRFDDLLKLYPIFSSANYDEKALPVSYWLETMPAYVLDHCNLMEYGETGYDSQKSDFNSLINYVQRDLEVDYQLLEQSSTSHGRIGMLARAFPYGGLDRLVYFLSYFDCRATRMDAGFGPYQVSWQTNGEFDVTAE